MFCRNCGQEVNEKEKFCSHCGIPLQEVNERDAKKSNKHVHWKKLIFLLGLAMVVIILINMKSGKNSEETIRKLQQFTTVDETDVSYVFNYKDIWALNYAKDNEFIRIWDYAVYDCFSEMAGGSDFGNDGNFIYDFDDNEFRMYIHYESPNGVISMINYEVDSGKMTVMKDDEWYYASEEMEEFIKSYGLVDIMKGDIEDFQTVLESQGITLDQVKDIKYKDVIRLMK